MRVIAIALLGGLLAAAAASEAADGLPAGPARGPDAAPVSTAVPAARTASTARAAPRKPDRALDRLELDSTAITGNRELPKVMSIVPWKPAEPPAGPDRPMGSLIEEVLAPVDRDEFRREITYFRDLTSQSAATRPDPSPGATQP